MQPSFVTAPARSLPVAPVASTTVRVPSIPLFTPSVVSVIGAIGGMLLFGIATMLAAEKLAAIRPGSLLLPASLVGATLLTAPALFALHQFLRLSARPDAMIAALARAWVAAGQVAAGIAPVGLFFAATTSLWPVVLVAGFALCGVVAAIVAIVSLHDAEASLATPTPAFTGLVLGWTVLTVAIALRIAFEIAELTWIGWNA
jgi:hypothetical protein